jgi:mevalonate pyrophosphate decarboxylase
LTLEKSQDGFITVLRIHKEDIESKIQDMGLNVKDFNTDQLLETISEDMSDNEYIMNGFWQIIENHIDELIETVYQCKICKTTFNPSAGNIDLIVHSKNEHKFYHNYETIYQHFNVITQLKQGVKAD